jgi:hypothetical protein
MIILKTNQVQLLNKELKWETKRNKLVNLNENKYVR